MFLHKDQYASYRLLGREFAKRGYTMEESLRAYDKARFVTYTSPSGAQWKTRAALIHYPCISERARYISRNKEVAYRLAHENGVSIPYTKYLHAGKAVSSDTAQKLLKAHDHLVVKPSNASLSHGLSVNVRTEKSLQAAITRARRVSPTVLIQEQVEGEEIRFVVMNGKVVSALLRRTARVIGDGISTIAELIERENAERRSLAFEYISYPQLDANLVDEALLHNTRIPAHDEIVELNRATMIRDGASVYDIADEIHSSYKTMVEKLCKKLDTRFIVVDVFVGNYHEPCAAHNYWFIEFNTSPVLKLFYGCRNGKMFDIVPKLVENIDRTLHAKKRTKRPTIGSFETVELPDFGGASTVAKTDTGAYSGALYVTHLRQGKDAHGRAYLSFWLFDDPTHVCTAYDFYMRKVRSAHGHVQKRYVIQTYLKIQGNYYETEIGLSNRSNMKYSMLLGRKFLRDNKMLVDVIVNEAMDREKELLG